VLRIVELNALALSIPLPEVLITVQLYKLPYNIASPLVLCNIELKTSDWSKYAPDETLIDVQLYTLEVLRLKPYPLPVLSP
jgi:hypothetical protein